MLLRVALILVQPVLQFQGQCVVVGPYHFQNLPETANTAQESASIDTTAQRSKADRSQLWHLFLQYKWLLQPIFGSWLTARRWALKSS